MRIKDKIDVLCKNIEKLNNKILETHKNLEDITFKQSEDIKKLLSNSNELLEQNKTTQDKLDKINELLENIIPENDWSVFLIYKISDSEYHVIRTMTKYLNRRKNKFKEYKKLYEFTLPSSIQYFSSFRDEYKDELDIKYNLKKIMNVN